MPSASFYSVYGLVEASHAAYNLLERTKSSGGSGTRELEILDHKMLRLKLAYPTQNYALVIPLHVNYVCLSFVRSPLKCDTVTYYIMAQGWLAKPPPS